MKRRQMLEILLGLGAGIFFVVLAVRFLQHRDFTMALLTGAAGTALLVLAGQDFAKWRDIQ